MSFIINPNAPRDHQGRCLDCKDSGLRLIELPVPAGWHSVTAIYQTCPCMTVVIETWKFPNP